MRNTLIESHGYSVSNVTIKLRVHGLTATQIAENIERASQDGDIQSVTVRTVSTATFFSETVVNQRRFQALREQSRRDAESARIMERA